MPISLEKFGQIVGKVMETLPKEFEPYLRPIYMGEGTRLYEIVGFPP